MTQPQQVKMKIFIEVLKQDPDDMDYYLISRFEKSSLAKAQKALTDLVISSDEKKRIHKCYHDEHPPKKCEIL